jgi:hypothetical protein
VAGSGSLAESPLPLFSFGNKIHGAQAVR